MFFAPSKSTERAKIFDFGAPKITDHIQIKIKMPNSYWKPLASLKALNEDLKDMDVLCTLKSQRAKILIMSVLKTTDHIQIKIKMPNPSQEPRASFKAPIEDLKDMYVLCACKINVESKNLDHGYIKEQ